MKLNLDKRWKVVIAVVAGLFILGIFKDQAIKTVVSAVSSNVTGAKTEISGFSLGLLTQSVRIRGLRVYNPKGFSRGILLEVSEARADYDLFALLGGKLHLRRADLNLKELGLEKNKSGKLNVDSLKITQQAESGKGEQGKPAKQLSMQLDLVNLKIGRIVMKDYSSGNKEPAIQVYEVNLAKSYKNITSAQQLAALIMIEPMKAAGIKSAQVYAVTALAGVAILPAALAVTFAGKDSAEEELHVSFDSLYDISSGVLRKNGKVSGENKQTGVISAEVNGSSVKLELKRINNGVTKVTVSARKFMMPKPEVASGILYQIKEKLK
jgi:uncharacterized protein involved in outer membrane biogenesis